MNVEIGTVVALLGIFFPNFWYWFFAVQPNSQRFSFGFGIVSSDELNYEWRQQTASEILKIE